jgi:predicted GNAT family acetyltransferase
MAWEMTDDLDRFVSAAGEFLRSEPVRHTVFLTVIGGLRSRGPSAYGQGTPQFGWWTTDTGRIAGILVQTPPYPAMFSALPAAAVTALAGRSFSGVNMPAEAAAAFTADWQARTGGAAHLRMRTRLFRLDRLVPPDPAPPGAARPATVDDRPLVLAWTDAFHDFIGERPANLAEVVDDRLASGVTLWEDDGAPVAMAARSHAEAGMVRVLNVFTPPGHRRRGYGGGVTAAATRAALEAGATDVVLFTDLANPTSNALYPRLGYRPIEDRTVVEFSS